MTRAPSVASLRYLPLGVSGQSAAARARAAVGGRRGSSPAPRSIMPRVERFARVLVSASHQGQDFRSVRAMCGASTVGIAAGTFRGWCRGVQVHAAEALGFTRILCALLSTRRTGGRVEDYLDADYRTVKALMARGGLCPGQCDGLSIEDYCRSQRFIRNDRVIGAIVKLVAVEASHHGDDAPR